MPCCAEIERERTVENLIQKIEVEDKEVRISGSKEALSTALTGQLGQRPPVLGFVSKWRSTQFYSLQSQQKLPAIREFPTHTTDAQR